MFAVLRNWVRVLRLVPANVLLLLSVLMVICGVSEGVGIVMLIPFLETVQGGSGEASGLLSSVIGGQGIAALGTYGILALFIVLIGVRSVAVYWRDMMTARVRVDVGDGVRLRCLGALTGARWGWLAAQRQTDHAAVLMNEVGRVSVGSFVLLTLAVNAVTAVIYLGVAFALSWPMTLVAVVGGGLLPWALARRRKSSLHLGQDMTRTTLQLQSVLQQGLAGLKTIKGQGNEQTLIQDAQRAMTEARHRMLAFQGHTGLARAMTQTVGATLLALYVLAGLTVWPMSLETLITLVVIFARLVPMAITMQQLSQQLSHHTAALQTVNAVIGQAEAASERREGPCRPPCFDREICLSGVSVHHDRREGAALHQVSVRIPAGQMTAVMGPSGSGKSTLVDVMTGLVQPDQGTVSIDGVDLADIDLALWRRKIAYVPQEITLFHDTIEANLIWGIERPSVAAIHEALTLAAADFVFDLPDGVQTVVGDGGRCFSGGERQRLALARALLRQPEILLLDEATSALDRDNEDRIHQALQTVRADPKRGRMTMIVISHRLTMLTSADQVIVLSNGMVMAAGPLDEPRVDRAIRQYLA